MQCREFWLHSEHNHFRIFNPVLVHSFPTHRTSTPRWWNTTYQLLREGWLTSSTSWSPTRMLCRSNTSQWARPHWTRWEKKKKDETQTESEGRTSVRFLSGRVEGSEGQKERDRRRERQRGGGRGERGPKKSWEGVKEWVERSLKEAEGNWQRVRLRENKWNMS